jgi:four helix bundle protein
MSGKKESPLKTKSFHSAIRITRLYKYISDHKKEYVLNKQLLRSGTAVGALIREAQNAESKQDFIHKMELLKKNVMKRFTGLNY